MPELTGRELLPQITKQYPDTPVIMLTGHATLETGIEAIRRGAFDYLIKPVEFDHLYNKIIQAHEKKIRNEEKKREEALRAAMEKQLRAAERLAALGVADRQLWDLLPDPDGSAGTGFGCSAFSGSG